MTEVPDHVGFVPQQSADKIGDLFIDNRGFCLQLCTKPNWKEHWGQITPIQEVNTL